MWLDGLTDLLLAALVAGTFHAGQAAALGVWRGIGPVVEVEVEVQITVVVVVDEAGRAAVQYTPFAFRWAVAIKTLAPHASRKVRAVHGRTGAPKWVGRGKTKGVITGEWVPGFPRQYGTPSDRLLAAAVRSVGGPVSRCDARELKVKKPISGRRVSRASPSGPPSVRAGLVLRAGEAIAHTEFDCGGMGAVLDWLYRIRMADPPSRASLLEA